MSKRWVSTLILIIVIVGNLYVYVHRSERNFICKEKRRELTTGFSHNWGQEFIYFYYYKDLFPVALPDIKKDYSEKAADDYLSQHGKDLLMEYNHWVRFGNHSRIFCYLPNAILTGTAENPSINLFNFLVFIGALVTFYIGMRKAGHSFLALIVIALVNTQSFFLYEVFVNENIFGLLASVFLLVCGLNAVYIFKPPNNYKYLLIPILSGVLISFFAGIRGEINVVLISVLLIYIFSIIRPLLKILSIALLLGFFFITQLLTESYFDSKIEQAENVIEKSGGHIYNGKMLGKHPLWHTVFCGLGDFDKKYGYKWHDTVAYWYGVPKMSSLMGHEFKYSGKYHLDEYYDSNEKYYKKPDDFVEYEGICKEKVLSDIENDPLWFVGIMIKRLNRIFSNTLPFQYAGYLLLPALIVVFFKRKWRLFVLLLSSMPLSLTPLVIFSGGNSTFNSIFPFFAIAVLLLFLFELIRVQKRKAWQANT